jgi:hypothetical protein
MHGKIDIHYVNYISRLYRRYGHCNSYTVWREEFDIDSGSGYSITYPSCGEAAKWAEVHLVAVSEGILRT